MTSADAQRTPHRCGVVAIGRNEGERLRRCLASLDPAAATVVYVDSGSTDGSVEAARAAGCLVVDLDTTIPFTAARARNAGFARLLEADPDVAHVQFLDGDCEVAAGWLDAARAWLDAHPADVAVCGRRTERHPERSVYNAMADVDWNPPPGEVRAFGGDVMLRAAALRDVGGYDPNLIAGEEPELCIRLRRAGWTIRALDRPMTLHDAQMLRFGQWWTRTVRSGFAYAQGAAMHGAPPERHWVAERRRALVWAVGLPLAAVVAAAAVSPWLGLAVLALYPLQVARLALRSTLPTAFAWKLAVFRVVGRFAEAAGVVRFWRTRRAGAAPRLIEYK